MNVMPSIFGLAAPKFAYNGNDVLLDYSVVLKSEAEDLDIIHSSIINGHREWIEMGEHWLFEVMVNLFKYSDPKAKFNEIWACKKKLVTLWQRRDRDPFKDDSGNIVLFRLNQIIPTWIDSPLFPDRLILKFASQDPVNIKYSTMATLIDDLGRTLLDDLGTSLPTN